MVRTRIKLQYELEEILGCRRVYFQSPENLKLEYPCIIYNLEGVDNVRADDQAYLWNKRYFVTIIDRDPDSDIWEKMIRRFEHCSLDRTAVNDNLHHWYMTLYW